ncbi:hypothetical protein IW261DRAFT_1574381 [Armillaria novae-zelandiae]|uniref:Uncharacterized protein n=1 Tax=Armillaria novae-zelandiae TaxID=153914 RepID=A0AA39T5X1_9AGAR|nr:hypothetical protein IW261DRAFT_1574381 [Armillaria novae-zelandiae]
MHGMITKLFYGPRSVPDFCINIQMAPPGWCSSEQNDWFDVRLPGFHQARLKGKPGEFLAEAVSNFIDKWQYP